MNEDDPPRRSARPSEVEHDPRDSQPTDRRNEMTRHEGRQDSSNQNGKRPTKHYSREGPDEIKGTFGRRFWGTDSRTKKKYWQK